MNSPSWEKEKDNLLHVIAVTAACAGLYQGVNIASVAGAVLFIQRDMALSSWAEELFISAMLLGATFGAAVAGPLSDRFGRRHMMVWGAVIGVFGPVGSAVATTGIELIAARVVIGLVTGILSVTIPLYVAELSPANQRGRLVTYFTVGISVGAVTAYWIDYLLAHAEAWRWMLGVGALPSVGLGIALMFMPRSPRWLISHGHTDLARHVLIRTSEDPEREVATIQQSLGQLAGGWRELLNTALRPLLLLGMMLALCREITGGNSLRVYSPIIFKMAGIESPAKEILAAVAVGMVTLLLAFVAMRFVDSAGRRILLLTGLGIMTGSFALLGLSFALVGVLSQVQMEWMIIICVVSIGGSWMLGLGAVIRLLIAEIFPLKVRGKAMSVATVVQWFGYFIATLPFLNLVHWLGPSGTFWLYAIISVGAWGYCFKYAPETNGRTLESIEQEFLSRRNDVENAQVTAR